MLRCRRVHRNDLDTHLKNRKMIAYTTKKPINCEWLLGMPYFSVTAPAATKGHLSRRCERSHQGRSPLAARQSHTFFGSRLLDGVLQEVVEDFVKKLTDDKRHQVKLPSDKEHAAQGEDNVHRQQADVRQYFSRLVACQGVSVSVPPCGMVGLMGRWHAGKMARLRPVAADNDRPARTPSARPPPCSYSTKYIEAAAIAGSAATTMATEVASLCHLCCLCLVRFLLSDPRED